MCWSLRLTLLRHWLSSSTEPSLPADRSASNDSLNPGDQHSYAITVTAPGLLTVETTGSTDTAGMLSGIEAAMDDSSGSGNNFRIVAPVSATSYTVSVDGQTPSTEGAYTVDMDFKVAMQSATGVTGTGVMLPTAPAWGDATSGTPFAADDTMFADQEDS